MDILELIKERHSVRQYLEKEIESNKRDILEASVKECNNDSGLNIQLIFDDPKCFNSLLAKITRFKGCNNYIAIVGKKDDPKLEEKAGYFGEKIVLKAQELGLNTCWVGATHGKVKATIQKNEKLVIIIALGYGATQGVVRKSKKLADVSKTIDNLPEWYIRGVEAALLAPTALNQQKFTFTLNDGVVKVTAGKGSYSLVDLGIVKYHFEVSSGHKTE